MSGWLIALALMVIGVPIAAALLKLPVRHIGFSILWGALIFGIAWKAGAR